MEEDGATRSPLTSDDEEVIIPSHSVYMCSSSYSLGDDAKNSHQAQQSVVDVEAEMLHGAIHQTVSGSTEKLNTELAGDPNISGVNRRTDSAENKKEPPTETNLLTSASGTQPDNSDVKVAAKTASVANEAEIPNTSTWAGSGIQDTVLCGSPPTESKIINSQLMAPISMPTSPSTRSDILPNPTGLNCGHQSLTEKIFLEKIPSQKPNYVASFLGSEGTKRLRVEQLSESKQSPSLSTLQLKSGKKCSTTDDSLPADGIEPKRRSQRNRVTHAEKITYLQTILEMLSKYSVEDVLVMVRRSSWNYDWSGGANLFKAVLERGKNIVPPDRSAETMKNSFKLNMRCKPDEKPPLMMMFEEELEQQFSPEAKIKLEQLFNLYNPKMNTPLKIDSKLARKPRGSPVGFSDQQISNMIVGILELLKSGATVASVRKELRSHSWSMPINDVPLHKYIENLEGSDYHPPTSFRTKWNALVNKDPAKLVAAAKSIGDTFKSQLDDFMELTRSWKEKPVKSPINPVARKLKFSHEKKEIKTTSLPADDKDAKRAMATDETGVEKTIGQSRTPPLVTAEMYERIYQCLKRILLQGYSNGQIVSMVEDDALPEKELMGMTGCNNTERSLYFRESIMAISEGNFRPLQKQNDFSTQKINEILKILKGKNVKTTP